MKSNAIIICTLLGIAIACPAQSTNPPANQEPVRPRDAFIASSEDALITAGSPPQSFDPFAAKSADGGNVRILNREAAVELARDLAKRGRYDEARALRALLNDETQDGTTRIEPVDKRKADGSSLDLKSTKGASNGNVRIVRRQDGSVFIENVTEGKQTSNPPKPTDDATLNLVFANDAEPGASQRLTLTADPAATATFQGTNPAATTPSVTRLYPLKGIITRPPAEVDDDAHNKKADEAYKAKIEALTAWVKTVLEHSGHDDATFAFSSDAGALVVKGTETQHELLTKAMALFEDNYGK